MVVIYLHQQESAFDDPCARRVRREASPEAEAQPQKKRRVWEDPDDPALVVPVAGQARLRKLRDSEEESQLTGALLLR